MSKKERGPHPFVQHGPDNKGFTIIEMLVVLAIIGFIAALAVPTYSKFVQKTRETAVVAYIKTIMKAQEDYRLYSSSDIYADDFGELKETGLVTDVGGGDKTTRHDYEFKLDAKKEGSTPTWEVKAEPVGKDDDELWFYADETGVIRYELGKKAKSSSPQFSG